MLTIECDNFAFSHYYEIEGKGEYEDRLLSSILWEAENLSSTGNGKGLHSPPLSLLEPSAKLTRNGKNVQKSHQIFMLY